MRRMKKARQYLLGIFAALLLCGIFSVNTVKADTQYVYDNASLLSDEVSALAPSACINCGRCVSVCPGQILPARLSVFAEHGEKEKFLKYGGMECCECGCCSFICPARRPLTQEISSMRKVLLAKRKKK